MINFDDAANEVLLQKKYDVLMDRMFDIYKLISELLTKLIRFIFSKLNFSLPPASKYNPELISRFFLIAGIILLVVVIGVIVIIVSKRKKRNQSMEEIFQDLKENVVTYTDLLNKGKDHARKGQYREAIRFEYVALLWVLNLKNIIHIDQAKSNNQLKRELSKTSSQYAATFNQIVEIFNISWFGHKKITPETYESYNTSLEGLMREVQHFEKTN